MRSAVQRRACLARKDDRKWPHAMRLMVILLKKRGAQSGSFVGREGIELQMYDHLILGGQLEET